MICFTKITLAAINKLEQKDQGSSQEAVRKGPTYGEFGYCGLDQHYLVTKKINENPVLKIQLKKIHHPYLNIKNG